MCLISGVGEEWGLVRNRSGDMCVERVGKKWGSASRERTGEVCVRLLRVVEGLLWDG